MFVGKPIKEWGKGLMSVLPAALDHVRSQGRYYQENKDTWYGIPYSYSTIYILLQSQFNYVSAYS